MKCDFREGARISLRYGKAIGMVGWGHLGLPFLCGREVEVRPGSYRGPAAAVNSGDCAVPVRGNGSPILPGASREGSSGRERPEN